MDGVSINTEVELPAEYRVVLSPGLQFPSPSLLFIFRTDQSMNGLFVAIVSVNSVNSENERDSKQLITEFGSDSVVIVEEIDGHRARISNPVQGWINMALEDGTDVIVPHSALPAKYRVILAPGHKLTVTEFMDEQSDVINELPTDTVVTVISVIQKRARISKPLEGWISLYNGGGFPMIQKVVPQNASILFPRTLHFQLRDTAQNQLNFFRLFCKRYPKHEPISKEFWESVIIDYEIYMEDIDVSQISQSFEVTLEIEFVWRVHMIHPQYYVADCIRRLGKIIAHDASDTNINFPPHDVNEFRKTFMETNATGTGLISSEFNMFAAVKKYMKFVRRMDELSVSQHITDEMLDGAIYRYERYLNAFRKSTATSPIAGDAEFHMIPTRDIELMWCSHLLNPKGYYSFCQDQNHCPTKKLHRPENDHLVIAHSPTFGMGSTSGDNVDDAVEQSVRKWDDIYGTGDYDDLWQHSRNIGQVSFEETGGGHRDTITRGRNVDDNGGRRQHMGTSSESSEDSARDRIGRYVCCACFSCCWLWVLIGGLVIFTTGANEDETLENVWIFTSGAIVTFSVLFWLATCSETIQKKKRLEAQRQREMMSKANANGNEAGVNTKNGSVW